MLLFVTFGPCSLRILYGLPKTMRKDLPYAAGNVVVKDHKQDLNGFFTISLRNRKFEISCCDMNRASFFKQLIIQLQALITRKSGQHSTDSELFPV